MPGVPAAVVTKLLTLERLLTVGLATGPVSPSTYTSYCGEGGQREDGSAVCSQTASVMRRVCCHQLAAQPLPQLLLSMQSAQAGQAGPPGCWAPGR